MSKDSDNTAIIYSANRQSYALVNYTAIIAEYRRVVALGYPHEVAVERVATQVTGVIVHTGEEEDV